ncbi:plakophilin-3a isoform X2 [Parambassis ranga]|uniref:Plakophilin-3a isoform X2 n=1 Tax=Parambassis ranga TaxID=210632 RepID=A0A6P7KBK5_9TELE|nr:plakophilin-3 isoform X2 [Parambassis ranga]
MPNSAVTTYALPSDIQLGNGSSVSDEVAKARRVQQQVQMRLSMKPTLPRQNGSASHYAASDYDRSSTMKYSTYSPNFSSKSSYVYSGSKTMGPHVSQRQGFSCQSAGPDMTQFHRISVGGGGVGVGAGGSGFYQEDVRMGGYQGSIRQPETMSMHSMRQGGQLNWMVDGSDAGSMVSERDGTLNRHYAHSAINGYSSQVRQGGAMTFQAPPRRQSLSGTLSRGGGGMSAGGAEIIQQPSFKGPAHRTISRITQRNRMSNMSGTLQHQMSVGGSSYGGGDTVDRGFIVSTLSGSQGNLLQRQGTLSRAMSVKSMHSVGRGMDIYGQGEMGASMGNLSGIALLDMNSAVEHLKDDDPDMQVLGAAYIQHQCYNDNESKHEVRRINGISELVKLFNSDNPEVRRYVTGATRNLIYENMENKMSLIEEGGIEELVKALGEPDEELRKNITGILWNLSSKDNLKEKLARETLSDLTEKILVPLSAIEVEQAEKSRDEDAVKIPKLSPSHVEIFCNTTGCLRNLSSGSEKTRYMMRETHGLVDSLVDYIQACVEKNDAEGKGVENATCVLRNLSYQLYSEIPPAAARRLEGPTRDQAKGKGQTVGCFTPQSRKAKNKQNISLNTLNEVARVPKGMELLWHPLTVGTYNGLLHKCETNTTTREAAAGALQNITAGDKRWASVLSSVALEHERMLPFLLDYLRTEKVLELRSLTGFLRNLSRHANNKDDMSTKTVNRLVEKLPSEGFQKEASSEVVVNICGILNNLVTGSFLAARDITYFDGIPKLMAIKNARDNSPTSMKTAKAAATVLSNMYHYKKLHKDFEKKGYTRADFTDITI